MGWLLAASQAWGGGGGLGACPPGQKKVLKFAFSIASFHDI